MSGLIISLVSRPDSQVEISRLAEISLKNAGAINKLPTPIDDLVIAAGIQDELESESIQERFLEALPRKFREVYRATLQKVRGIADLRERAVYVPRQTAARRVLFAKAHELGHQVIPWQRVNHTYLDDDLSLSSEVQDIFDVEANFYAAEVIFQGHRFRTRMLDYMPTLEAVFSLADEHGASKHATLRRFVEEHDETIAAVPYWPNWRVLDKDGYPLLKLGKVFGSPRFVYKYSDLELPEAIASDHPWTEARKEYPKIFGAEVRLIHHSHSVQFQWQSWWNNYCLLVLLRRRPTLGLLRQIVR